MAALDQFNGPVVASVTSERSVRCSTYATSRPPSGRSIHWAKSLIALFRTSPTIFPLQLHSLLDSERVSSLVRIRPANERIHPARTSRNRRARLDVICVLCSVVALLTFSISFDPKRFCDLQDESESNRNYHFSVGFRIQNPETHTSISITSREKTVCLQHLTDLLKH
jgi:hypothetical protein